MLILFTWIGKISVDKTEAFWRRYLTPHPGSPTSNGTFFASAQGIELSELPEGPELAVGDPEPPFSITTYFHDASITHSFQPVFV